MEGEEEDKRNKILEVQLKKFYERKVKIHLNLLNTRFRNGFIKEMSGDLIIFIDDVIGAEELYVFQIADCSVWKEKKG